MFDQEWWQHGHFKARLQELLLPFIAKDFNTWLRFNLDPNFLNFLHHHEIKGEKNLYCQAKSRRVALAFTCLADQWCAAPLLCLLPGHKHCYENRKVLVQHEASALCLTWQFKPGGNLYWETSIRLHLLDQYPLGTEYECMCVCLWSRPHPVWMGLNHKCSSGSDFSLPCSGLEHTLIWTHQALPCQDLHSWRRCSGQWLQQDTHQRVKNIYK